jgi:hypothetical protein
VHLILHLNARTGLWQHHHRPVLALPLCSIPPPDHKERSIPPRTVPRDPELVGQVRSGVCLLTVLQPERIADCRALQAMECLG